MGFFLTVKQIFEDFALWVRQRKWKYLLTLFILAVGVIVGVVLFVKSQQNWWYINRCSYARLLVGGNIFLLLFSLILQTTIILSVMLLACSVKYMYFLNYLLVFLCGLYSGANIACVFVTVGFLGVFYAVLYTAVELASFTFVLYHDDMHTTYCKRIEETFKDCKVAVCAICLLTIVKFLLLFLILRPLSASI